MISVHASSIIANRKPFTCNTVKTSWFGRETIIYYNGTKFGNVSNKELGEQLVVLLNAATVLGSSSGYAYASTQTASDIAKIDLNDTSYKPYALEVYKDRPSAEDNDYDFSIVFEEGMVRCYKNISRTALQNSVNALNQAHHIGFNDGVKLAQLEAHQMENKIAKLETMFESPNPSI